MRPPIGGASSTYLIFIFSFMKMMVSLFVLMEMVSVCAVRHLFRPIDLKCNATPDRGSSDVPFGTCLFVLSLFFILSFLIYTGTYQLLLLPNRRLIGPALFFVWNS